MHLATPTRIARVLVALACTLTLSTCESGPTPDELTSRLLDRYDLHANGSTTVSPLEVGAAERDGMPWDEYLRASRAINLDFSRWYGEHAEVRTTPLEGGAPNLALHVLVLDGRAIGAWLSAGEDDLGGSLIYPLDDPPP